MNMDFKREMPTARVIKEMYPLSDKLVETKANNDAEVRQIFLGQSHKFLLVIGPCSADREDAVLEYIGRLREVQDKVQDKIVIVPRIYTNKPRTTGAGYKGMLHQPDPNNSPDLLKGLIAIRKLHVDALEKTGFSCADEMLYPENHRYLSDCLSYVAVGARSVEDQQHRLVNVVVDKCDALLRGLNQIRCKNVCVKNLPVVEHTLFWWQRCAHKEINLVLQLMYLLRMFLQLMVDALFHIYKVLVDAIAPQQIFFENSAGPLTELHTTNGVNSIPNTDNHIKVVKCHLVSLSLTLQSTVLSGCCIFCNYHVLAQLSTFKDVSDVTRNG